MKKFALDFVVDNFINLKVDNHEFNEELDVVEKLIFTEKYVLPTEKLHILFDKTDNNFFSEMFLTKITAIIQKHYNNNLLNEDVLFIKNILENKNVIFFYNDFVNEKYITDFHQNPIQFKYFNIEKINHYFDLITKNKNDLIDNNFIVISKLKEILFYLLKNSNLKKYKYEINEHQLLLRNYISISSYQGHDMPDNFYLINKLIDNLNLIKNIDIKNKINFEINEFLIYTILGIQINYDNLYFPKYLKLTRYM